MSLLKLKSERPFSSPTIRSVEGHKQCVKASTPELSEAAAAATSFDEVGVGEVEGVAVWGTADVVMARPNKAKGSNFILNRD